MTSTTTIENETITLTEKQFKRDIKGVFWKALVTTVLGCATSALLTVVPFYFNTNAKFADIEKTQDAHSKNIEDLTKVVQNLVTTSAVESTKPENLSNEINDIKKRMDRYEEKQDKILDLLIEIKQKK